LLKEIAIREENLPNVVIDALIVLLSTDFEEYYRNYKPDDVTEVTTNNKKKSRASKRKNVAASIATNTAATGTKKESRRKRARSNGNGTSKVTNLIEENPNAVEDVGLLDPFDLALDEYFVYENAIGTRHSSDSSNLSFDVMGEIKDDSPEAPKQQPTKTRKTRSNSV